LKKRCSKLRVGDCVLLARSLGRAYSEQTLMVVGVVMPVVTTRCLWRERPELVRPGLQQRADDGSGNEKNRSYERFLH
jgi:hypothetical protein